MRRAVFLDRDGVLNKAIVRDGKPYPPRSLEEVTILSGTKEALQRLRAAGFLNIVVTNQPDVGAGKQTRESVDAINDHLHTTLPIDGIRVCYHVEADDCSCRKPKPGMLVEAAQELGIDLNSSSLVGDRWRDVAAAQAAGCRAYFIDYGYSEKRPIPPYIAVGSLSEAAGLILRSK